MHSADQGRAAPGSMASASFSRATDVPGRVAPARKIDHAQRPFAAGLLLSRGFYASPAYRVSSIVGYCVAADGSVSCNGARPSRRAKEASCVRVDSFSLAKTWLTDVCTPSTSISRTVSGPVSEPRRKNLSLEGNPSTNRALALQQIVQQRNGPHRVRIWRRHLTRMPGMPRASHGRQTKQF